MKYAEVGGNGFPCDFCDNKRLVGWVRVMKPNRSSGGWLDGGVFMVCAEHIKVGTAVYPVPDRILTEESA